MTRILSGPVEVFAVAISISSCWHSEGSAVKCMFSTMQNIGSSSKLRSAESSEYAIDLVKVGPGSFNSQEHSHDTR